MVKTKKYCRKTKQKMKEKERKNYDNKGTVELDKCLEKFNFLIFSSGICKTSKIIGEYRTEIKKDIKKQLYFTSCFLTVF